MSVILGVDVGGTFTDIFLWDEDNRVVRGGKVLSTPRDQSIGILRGLTELRVPLLKVGLIAHGTTVATNAILERQGARCALITTKGFRDVIELKRRDRPELWNMRCIWEPLIPRNRRYEVEERVTADGEILKEVSEDEIRAIAKRLVDDRVECAIVAFFNSYANPSNERKAAEILRQCWPNHYICVSTEIVNEYREFERMSTSVTNAYVQPKIDAYLSTLMTSLKERDFGGDISIVHSSGGLMSLEMARKFPVRTLVSGPSAGVMVACYLSDGIGYKNVISCDMGGTSFDSALIKDGKTGIVAYKELTYGVPLLVSQIDMVTIGAGGGSIAWLDRSGILQVGPQSAGADPGPACHGTGGTEPTVTDANLVLGRISTDRPIGEAKELTLNVDLAREAIKSKVADPLGLTTEEAASAIVRVVNANMAGSIRLISISRGHDPRDFVLMAFGGAGPLHGYAIARELGIPEVIVPPYPGVFCALGCMLIPFQYTFVETLNKTIDDLDLKEVKRVFLDQMQRGQRLMDEKRAFLKESLVTFEADMHYKRQTHFVHVSLTLATLSKQEMTEAFNSVYKQQRGELVEGVAINVMNLRTTITGVRPEIELKMLLPPTSASSLREAKRCVAKLYWEEEVIDCNIFERLKIPPEAVVKGPAIMEEPTATTFVEPGSMAVIDNFGNIILRGD